MGKATLSRGPKGGHFRPLDHHVAMSGYLPDGGLKTAGAYGYTPSERTKRFKIESLAHPVRRGVRSVVQLPHHRAYKAPALGRHRQSTRRKGVAIEKKSGECERVREAGRVRRCR